MEAVSFIMDWVKYLLIIVPVGAGATVTYYAVSKSFSLDAENVSHCDLRIRQTIKGAVIAMTISGLITAIKSFFL